MISLVFFRFWPAFLPLIAYYLWLYYVGRKATIDGRPVLGFRDGPWYWVVLSCLLIGLLCFIFLAQDVTMGEKGTYIPPHMEDGILVPGKIEKTP